MRVAGSFLPVYAMGVGDHVHDWISGTLPYVCRLPPFSKLGYVGTDSYQARPV